MNNKFNLVYRVGQNQNKKIIFIRHSIYGYEIVSRSDGKDTLIHDFKSQSQAIDSFSLMLRMNQDNNIPCYIDVEMTREIFKDESPFLIYRLNQTATVQVTTMYGEKGNFENYRIELLLKDGIIPTGRFSDPLELQRILDDVALENNYKKV